MHRVVGLAVVALVVLVGCSSERSMAVEVTIRRTLDTRTRTRPDAVLRFGRCRR